MTIKEVIFRPPLVNLNKAWLIYNIAINTPVELDVGTHDVTPPGYRDKYEVEVADPGNGDNVGQVIITRRGGKKISFLNDINDDNIIQEETEEKRVSLDKQGDYVVLGKPDTKSAKIKVHGVIYYDQKK